MKDLKKIFFLYIQLEDFFGTQKKVAEKGTKLALPFFLKKIF